MDDMTFQKQLGMENHPNSRTPSFFRGVGSTTNQCGVFDVISWVAMEDHAILLIDKSSSKTFFGNEPWFPWQTVE